MAARTLVDDLHERLHRRGYANIRPGLGFVLLAAREKPVSGKDVAELAGISKQAAAKWLKAIATDGYLRAASSGLDARVRPFRITPRGRKLLTLVDSVYADLEGEWEQVIGAQRLKELKAGLASGVLHHHGGRLPRIKPTW
jgi:DNA-binding MarR family transcriptional regulator